MSNEELINKLFGRGALGAFTWELDPDNARSTAQRLRRMADDPFFPVYRVRDPLYPKATKFAAKPLTVVIRKAEVWPA